MDLTAVMKDGKVNCKVADVRRDEHGKTKRTRLVLKKHWQGSKNPQRF